MKRLHCKFKGSFRKLFSLCVILIFTFTSARTVFATDVVKDLEKDSYVFVLKENTATQNIVRDLEGKFLDLNINDIEEIGTITISSSNTDEVKEAKDYLSKNYETYIEEVSEEKEVTIEEFQLLNAAAVTQIKKQKTFNAASQQTLQEVQEEEENIYDPWRWDINKVTSNGDSYELQEGNHTVRIAIVDSGIDSNHPDLRANILDSGKSFVPGVSATVDEIGHGTMVAGTVAANGKIKGISPKIGIVPYKVFEGYSADSSLIIEAIIQAADDDMDVINLSLGTYKSLKSKEDRAIYLSYKRAISYANRKGSLLVASSGTNGYDMSNPFKLAEQMGLTNDLQVHMPGGLANVVTVSATTLDDQLAYYSNYGSNVDIAAPAGDYGPKYLEKQQVDLEYMTLTTYPTTSPQSDLSKLLGFEQGYEFMIGTSLAAPKVSATAALIIAEYQEKYGRKPLPAVTKSLLYRGASDGDGTRKELGRGIVNAKNSLDYLNKR
ncbi:S8 family peptidase [Bacillus weihaiensis]|uniref:Peptidase S8 n=1 Tax=Bacillus weihaiensis TaxID=1547283 RepID=A0A1L3MVP0_9BACI|nr:S8 family serine peptidase [Bacillus weihaiensis]APH06403.1 peptidase S8 [Bacillus weihaiensis]